jgi:hypothetical protein
VLEQLLFVSVLRSSLILGFFGSCCAEDTASGRALGFAASLAVLGSLSATADFTAPALSAHTLARLLSQLPGIVDHELEIRIIIDGGRDVVVILNELLFGDDVVGSVVVAESVSSLEGLEELLKDLVLSLLALNDIGVLLGVVDTLDIVDVDPAVAILVELFVSLEDDLLAILAHGTADAADEFVEVDEARVVDIEVGEQLLHLTFSEAEHVVTASLGELVLVEGARVVVVHDLELALEADESTGTAGNQLLAHGIGEVVRGTHAGASSSSSHTAAHGLSVKAGSELLVVNTTGAVHVVNVEQGLKILLSRDHDTDLLDRFGEFVGFDEAGVVEVEVLERLR